MKTPLVKLILLNILIFIFVLLAYIVTGFSMGLAANSSRVPQQIMLFKVFVLFHLVINLILLYKMKITGLRGVAVSFSFILLLYVITAARFNFIG